MIKKISTLLVGISFSFITGCASTPSGEKFSSLLAPEDNKPLIYLYRINEYYGQALSFKVIIDGQEKGDIGNSAYMIIPTTQGDHSIYMKGFGYGNAPISIKVENGSINFLKVVTKQGLMGFSADLLIENVSKSQALIELPALNREPERFINKDL